MIALVLALALLAAPTPPPHPPQPPGTPPPEAWGKAPAPAATPVPSSASSGQAAGSSPVQQIVQNIYRVVVPVATFLDVFQLMMGEMTRQTGEQVMVGLAGMAQQLAGFSWENLYPVSFWEARFGEIHGTTMAVTGALAALMAALAIALHALGRAAGVPSDPRMILLEVAAGVMLAVLSLEIVRLSGRLALGLVVRLAPNGPLHPVANLAFEALWQTQSDPLMRAGPSLVGVLVLPVYVMTGFATLFALTGYATLLALWPVLLYAAAATGPLVAALWMARPSRFLWWVWLKLLLLANVAVVAVVALMVGLNLAGAGGLWRMFQLLLAMGIVASLAGLVTRSATVAVGAGASATVAAVKGLAGLAAAVATPAAGAAILGSAGAAGGMAGAGAAGGGLAGTALARHFLQGASLEAAGHALGIPSLAVLGRTVSRAGEVAFRQEQALQAEAFRQERAYRAEVLGRLEARLAANSFMAEVEPGQTVYLGGLLSHFRQGFETAHERLMEGLAVPRALPPAFLEELAGRGERMIHAAARTSAAEDIAFRAGQMLARELMAGPSLRRPSEGSHAAA